MLIQDQLPGDQINDENLSFLRAIGVDYLSLNPVPFAAAGRGESRLSTFASPAASGLPLSSALF